ncbi:MAG TPA: LysR family transcriptional regulator [Bryobacteraceae bacterium]|nr:LysR family transcriptional regulator [Bryobacteraceae bacterium]
MLNLQHLSTFLTVAALKNFNQAAIRLGYSQSSVTTHIKNLEKELGLELFERERFSKSVTLTGAGQRMLRYADRLLALERQAHLSVRGRSGG